MRGKPIEKEEIEKIVDMRKKGHSLPEICRSLKRGSSTVYAYAKKVKVLPEHADTLRQKQGGSKYRSEIQWKESSLLAKSLLRKIEKREKLFILASLYWGEGTKSGLDFINSDPEMIRVFVSCLTVLGVNKSELRLSLRVYDDVNILIAKKYWANICGVGVESILSANILKGKKSGKLPYGMCRVRVTKGSKYFKLIMSMIEFIKSEIK